MERKEWGTNLMPEREALVLARRPKVLDFHNEYAVLDEHGDVHRCRH